MSLKKAVTLSCIALASFLLFTGINYPDKQIQKQPFTDISSYLSKMDLSLIKNAYAGDQSAYYNLAQSLYYLVNGDPNDANAFSFIGLIGTVSDNLESGLKTNGLSSCKDLSSAIGFGPQAFGAYTVTISAPGVEAQPTGYSVGSGTYDAKIDITGPSNLDMDVYYECVTETQVSGKYVIQHDNITLPFGLGNQNIKAEVYFEFDTGTGESNFDAIIQEKTANTAFNLAFSFSAKNGAGGNQDYRLAVMRDVGGGTANDCGVIMEGSHTLKKVRARMYHVTNDTSATSDVWSNFGGELCVDTTTKNDGADCTGLDNITATQIRRSGGNTDMTMTNLKAITL